MNRTEIDKHLATVERSIAGMLVDSDHDEFMQAFAAKAVEIEDGAIAAEDCRYVRQRLDRMLEAANVWENY